MKLIQVIINKSIREGSIREKIFPIGNHPTKNNPLARASGQLSRHQKIINLKLKKN